MLMYRFKNDLKQFNWNKHVCIWSLSNQKQLAVGVGMNCGFYRFECICFDFSSHLKSNTESKCFHTQLILYSWLPVLFKQKHNQDNKEQNYQKEDMMCDHVEQNHFINKISK